MQTRLPIVTIVGISTLMLRPGPAAAANAAHEEKAPAAVSGPLSLAEAVRLAIERHPSVEASRAAVSSAQAQVRAVRSSRQLLITAASLLASRASAPIAFSAASPSLPVGPHGGTPFGYGWAMPPVPSYNQGTILTLPLYDGGRATAELRSARATQRAAESEVVGTEQEIALNTKEAYHAVLLAQAVAAVRQDAVQEVEGRLKEIEERYRNDGVALYEVLRFQAELAQARQQHNDAQRDLGIALLDLKTVLRLPLDQELTLADRLTVEPIPGTLEEQLAAAERQSPEIAAAEARCDAADEALKAARRASRPSFTAMAVTANVANIGARGLGGTVYGLSTYLPLFDAGLRRANREAAKGRVLEEQASCTDVGMKVKRDVAAIWLTLQTARENLRISETAASQAEQSYRALQLRYEARRLTQTELLDALAVLVRARLNHLQSLYSYNSARARLDRAVGRI